MLIKKLLIYIYILDVFIRYYDILYRTRSKEQSFDYCPLLVKIFFNTELSIIHVGAKY